MNDSLRLPRWAPLLSWLLLISMSTRAEPVSSREPDWQRPCLEAARLDAALAGQLAAQGLAPGSPEMLRIALAAGPTLATDDLSSWLELHGGVPVSTDRAIATVERAARSGLFEAVDLARKGDLLTLRLTEVPALSDVRIASARDTDEVELLRRLFKRPRLDDGECPANPPREWFAHRRHGRVEPGLLRGGLQPRLDRVLRWMRETHPLATLSGALGKDRTLVIEVDEGRLSGVALEGVDPALSDAVREALDLRTSEVLSSADLRAGLRAVRDRFPFLEVPQDLRQLDSDDASIEVHRDPAAVRFRTVESPPAERPPRVAAPDDREDGARETRDEDDSDDGWTLLRLGRRHHRAFHLRERQTRAFLRGHELVLRLHAHSFTSDLDGAELLKHTPATGFSPGLLGSATFWDPRGRWHATFDGGLWLNTRKPVLATPAPGGFPATDGRVDWLAGARLAAPALGLAELGGHVHALTDTEDRFRLAPIDSYLGSIWSGRADADYFKRAGAWGFATAKLGGHVLLGAELRFDRISGLLSPPGVYNIVSRPAEPVAGFPGLRGNGPATSETVGSAIGRLEWTLDPIDTLEVGSPLRDPNRSLLPGRFLSALSAFATLETARTGLGGDASYTKLVMDGRAFLQMGDPEQGLRLHTRVALGSRDLPLEKQEGLGGWGSLRGYGFKELRGDGSVLASVEARRDCLGAFVDGGAVRPVGGSFGDPRVSAGAFLEAPHGHWGDEEDGLRLTAAWRLDSQARAAPQLRLTFQRAW